MPQHEQLMMDMTLREMLDVVTSYYPNPYTPDEVTDITRMPLRVLIQGAEWRAEFADR